ncbi:MAG: hypothetical protein F6K47_06840 [Symploca sp. SIO2E6]|nr:hypothetical protein [Symploca sp. SIO2E6]
MQQKKALFVFLPFCFLLFGGILISCNKLTRPSVVSINASDYSVEVTKISDIPQNQEASATVHVLGEVITKAPFLGSGAYQLKDETGTIWIVTNQTLPEVGDGILLKGQLQYQSIPIGGQELGEVYIQEQEQLKRNAGSTKQSLADS